MTKKTKPNLWEDFLDLDGRNDRETKELVESFLKERSKAELDDMMKEASSALSAYNGTPEYAINPLMTEYWRAKEVKEYVDKTIVVTTDRVQESEVEPVSKYSFVPIGPITKKPSKEDLKETEYKGDGDKARTASADRAISAKQEGQNKWLKLIEERRANTPPSSPNRQ